MWLCGGELMMMYVLSLGGSEQALMCVCINREVFCAERCWPHDNQVSTARIAAQQCSEDCSESWMSSLRLHSTRCDQSSCPEYVVQAAEVLSGSAFSRVVSATKKKSSVTRFCPRGGYTHVVHFPKKNWPCVLSYQNTSKVSRIRRISMLHDILLGNYNQLRCRPKNGCPSWSASPE